MYFLAYLSILLLDVYIIKFALFWCSLYDISIKKDAMLFFLNINTKMHLFINFFSELRYFIVTVLWIVVLGAGLMYGQTIFNAIRDSLGFVPQYDITVYQAMSQFTRSDSTTANSNTNTHTQEEQNIWLVLAHPVLGWNLFASALQHEMKFNTLPPWHRVIIPSQGIKAPIVDIPYAHEEKLVKGDFYEELKQWVVKYPYTPVPGTRTDGNSVLFGHSSVEIWDRNEYGHIFQRLPKMNAGEIVTVVWNGVIHSYEVDQKVIKNPKDVGSLLSSRDDASYLTLMACYPLFSDAQRILVRAKLIDNPPMQFALDNKATERF